MFEGVIRKFVFMSAVLCALASAPRLATAFPICDSATNPDPQTFCDEVMHPENFEGGDSGKVCMAEPAPPVAGTVPEVLGSGICVSGMVNDSTFLVTLFVEVNSVNNPAALPERTDFDPNALTDGTFIDTLALPPQGPGTYIASTNALFIGGMGIPNIVTISRNFVQVDEPDLKITTAELENDDQDLTATISQDAGTGVYTLTTESIASRRLNICLANPEGDASGSKVVVTVTNDIETSEEEGKRFTLTKTCPSSADILNAQTESDTACCAAAEVAPEECDAAKIAELGCPEVEVFCARDGSCAAGSQNGFLIAGIPLGDGTNDLTVVVQNTVTGYDIGSGQVIEVASLDNQLNPTELCMEFFDQDGEYIPQVDARAVRADEVTAMTVVASFGACPETPGTIPAVSGDCDLNAPSICNDYDQDGLLDADDPDNDNDGICDFGSAETEGETVTCAEICESIGVEDCEDFLSAVSIADCSTPETVICTRDVADDPVAKTRACIQKGNEQLAVFERGNPDKLQLKFYEMCPAVSDPNKFVFRLESDDLKFPLGAATVNAWQSDVFTNKSVSFGYGELRSRFNDDGTLIRDEVGSALAGHIPASYLEVKGDTQGQLIDDIEIAVNTDKFKNDIFLALFKPQPPTREAIDECAFVGPQPDVFRAFNIFDPYIGSIDITELHLLSQNRAWVRLEIAGLRGYTEIFTLKCDTPDCEGLDIVDNQMQNAVFAVDPDTGMGILPVELTVNYLSINVEIQLSKDEEGNTVTAVRAVPGQNLLDAWGTGGRLTKFRCDQHVSRTSDKNGHIWIDQPACRDLEVLNDKINSQGLDPSPTTMNVDKQLMATIESQVSCLTPKILIRELGKFSTQSLMNFKLELFGKEFDNEIFADLLKADLNLGPRGVSFKGGSLVLPVGSSNVGEPALCSDANCFIDNLPEEFKNADFGYLSDHESGLVNPIAAARHLGKNINLAVKEEMVNMALHGVNMLVEDLLSKEPDFIDTNDFAIVDRFGMGVFVDTDTCLKLDDDGVLQEVTEDLDKNCFPLRLRPDMIFGANSFDFDSDGDSTEDSDLRTPLRLRLALNPYVPPMVQLISSSSPLDADGRADSILLAVKIALSDTTMAVFEDEVLDPDPEQNLRLQVETNEKVNLVNWCDRQPEAHPDCMTDKDVPMVKFRLDASLVLWLQYTPGSGEAKIAIKGGFKPRELQKPTGEIVIVPDREASFFKLSVKENNTPYSDLDLAGGMRTALNEQTLNIFMFGSGSEINLDIPTEFPEEGTCDDGGLDPDDPEDLFDLVHDFGFRSLGLDDPLLQITSGDPRYLGIGFNPVLNSCDSEPTDPPEEPDPGEDPGSDDSDGTTGDGTTGDGTTGDGTGDGDTGDGTGDGSDGGDGSGDSDPGAGNAMPEDPGAAGEEDSDRGFSFFGRRRF